MDRHALQQLSPLSKSTCVRQVVSDKWLPLSAARRAGVGGLAEAVDPRLGGRRAEPKPLPQTVQAARQPNKNKKPTELTFRLVFFYGGLPCRGAFLPNEALFEELFGGERPPRPSSRLLDFLFLNTNISFMFSFTFICFLLHRRHTLITALSGLHRGEPGQRPSTAIFHTKNCQTKNL